MKLNMELVMLLDHLEANQLPSIDFKKLLLRFCDELQLPCNNYFLITSIIIIITIIML